MIKHQIKRLLIIAVITTLFSFAGYHGVKLGLSAIGYRYIEEKEYQKALNNFAMANDKKGQGTALNGMKLFDQALKKFMDAKDWKGLGNVWMTHI